MEQSANLLLPYIMPSQAQKHVTHNEAIRRLDALVQLGVLDRDLHTPPVLPVDGDRYLVADGGTDAWTGKDSMVAAWQDGAWTFLAPKAGWLLWVADEDRLLGFDGAAWVDAALHNVNPASLVGVNTTADPTNRLAIKSPASLFDEEAGDHRLKINKASAVDTASLVFQSGYSGRAEFGLAGDDDWHVKVSADGAAWTEALKVDRTNGRVSLPAELPLGDENQVVTKRHVRELLGANRTYYVRVDGNDSNDGLADSSGGAFLTIQKAISVVKTLDLSIYSVTIQVGDGTWTVPVVFSGPWIGGGTVTLRGNPATPANCELNVTGTCLSVQNGAEVTISGLTFVGSTTGITAVNGGKITFGAGIVFGACGTYHMWANGAGSIIFTATQAYSITGSTSRHFGATPGSYINAFGSTVTITGSLTITHFAYAATGAVLNANSMTFTGGGTVAGNRYSASLNAVINTGGGGASYFPGSSTGSVATGGQYA